MRHREKKMAEMKCASVEDLFDDEV